MKDKTIGYCGKLQCLPVRKGVITDYLTSFCTKRSFFIAAENFLKGDDKET